MNFSEAVIFGLYIIALFFLIVGHLITDRTIKGDNSDKDRVEFRRIPR